MGIPVGQGEGNSPLCFPLLNSSCRKPRERSPPEYILLSIMLSSITLLTVFLNMLVIISISHFKQLHTATNVLLLSLSLADLVTGLLVMPVDSLFLLQSCWYHGTLLCIATIYIMFVLISASLGHMVLISVDRYLAVCDPLQYQAKVTLGRALAAIIVSWVCSLLYNTLFLLDQLIEPDVFSSCRGECVAVLTFNSGMVDLVVTFIAPCSVIVVLYMRVFVVALSQARGKQSKVVLAGVAIVTVKKSERKAARTLGIIVVVFLLCYVPYFLFSLSGNISSSSALIYLTLILQINSCLNPLIYALFYPWFRKTTKLILCLKILQKSSSLSNVI